MTCGKSAATFKSKAPVLALENGQLAKDTDFLREVMCFTNEIDFYEKQEMLADAFYNHVGLVRENGGLNTALDAIHQMKKELPLMGPKDKSKICNTNLVEFIEFGNKIELAEIIAECAIARAESRGAHYRGDIPTRNDDMFGTHTITWKKEGVLCVNFLQ